jgi:hypothetical protein
MRKITSARLDQSRWAWTSEPSIWDASRDLHFAMVTASVPGRPYRSNCLAGRLGTLAAHSSGGNGAYVPDLARDSTKAASISIESFLAESRIEERYIFPLVLSLGPNST